MLALTFSISYPNLCTTIDMQNLNEAVLVRYIDCPRDGVEKPCLQYKNCHLSFIAESLQSHSFL